MEKETAKKTTETPFLRKLLKAQEEIKSVIKDSTNPFHKSTYADINAFLSEVKPVLTRNKLLLHQPLKRVEGGHLQLTIIADADSEQNISSEAFIPDQADAQKFGAYSTYYRRYTLVSLMSLEAEDDDGNHAAGKTHTAPTAEKIVKPVQTTTSTKKTVTGAIFDPQKHSVIEMPFLKGQDAFMAKLKEIRELGGNYDFATKRWFVPKEENKNVEVPKTDDVDLDELPF